MLRPCKTDDFAGIVALLIQLWPDKQLDINSIRLVYDRALSSDSQNYICLTDNNKIIGFASLTIRNNLWQQGFLGHVDELVVDEHYRGRGFGTQLLEHIISLAMHKGCRRIELDTAFHRKDAHRFYEKHGFENRGYVFSKSLLTP
jgi:glucosamine-phosphate N-acetyltransferase